MASRKIIRTVLKFRRDTTEKWAENKKTVPAAGEPCFDIDLHTLKIGDGYTTYEDLNAIGEGKVEVAADEKSIILEDDIFKLFGFDAASVGAQPVKNEDGVIEWKVPAEVDFSGIEVKIYDIQNDISSIKDIVDALSGDKSTYGSIRNIVSGEINKFASDVSDDGVVNSYKELIDYAAEHGAETAEIIADVEDLKSKVGNKTIAEQIKEYTDKMTTTIKLGSSLLDKVDGITTIPVGAGLQPSDEIDFSDDGRLVLKEVSLDKLVQGNMEIVFNG